MTDRNENKEERKSKADWLCVPLYFFGMAAALAAVEIIKSLS